MKLALQTRHWLYLALHLVMFLGGAIIQMNQASSTVWFSVGTSLIAAALTGWIIFVYVFVSEDRSEKLRVLSEFGVLKAFEARSVRIKQEYVQRLDAAREQIDIVGFGLNALREDFLNDFQRWKRKANIRILLIDPEFPSSDHSYAAQRDIEEKNSGGQIGTQVKKFVEEVGHLIGAEGGLTFGIRLYRALPTANIFRIDDELFWGPYLIDDQSRNAPTFLVKKGGILFTRFSYQFDAIWNRFSREIPAEWLRQK